MSNAIKQLKNSQNIYKKADVGWNKVIGADHLSNSKKKKMSQHYS